MVTFPSRSIRSVRLLSERGTLPAQSHKSLSLFPACSPPLLLLVQVAKCSLTHPSFLQIGGKSAFSVKLGGNCRRTNGPRCYLGRIGQSLAAWAPPSTECLNFAFSCIPSFTLHPNLPSITLPLRTTFFGSQFLWPVLVINRC